MLRAKGWPGRRGRRTTRPGDADAAGEPAGQSRNRTVAGAGLTSALGDCCHETTTVILPGCLVVPGLPIAVLLLIGADAALDGAFVDGDLAAARLHAR